MQWPIEKGQKTNESQQNTTKKIKDRDQPVVFPVCLFVLLPTLCCIVAISFIDRGNRTCKNTPSAINYKL
jgi:hypothetical protein